MSDNNTAITRTATSRPLRIFLCHSSDDKPSVRNLYKQLCTEGIDAWLDEEKILPGQDWNIEIRKAVRESDVVILCLSHGSISKAGYVQKEIRFALDISDELPEGTLFIIPVKFEECEVPQQLRRWQWVNLFEPKGYERLLSSLSHRANALGISLSDSKKNVRDEALPSKSPRHSSSASKNRAISHGTSSSAENYFKQGVHSYTNGKYKEAIVDLSKAIQTRPDYGDAYYERGHAYYEIESFEQAIADFTRVIQLEPENPFAYYFRGDIYSAWLNQIDLGIVDMSEAVRLKPDFAQAYAGRGSAFRRKGNFAQAISDFQQAIRFEPQNQNAWYWMGLTYSEHEERDNAIECLGQAIRINPEYVNAYFNRGIEFCRNADFVRAIDDFDVVIERFPYYDHERFQATYKYRGLAHAQQREFSEALLDLNEAIRLSPKDAECYYHRGEIHSKMGEKGLAVADYRTALELAKSPHLQQQATIRIAQELGSTSRDTPESDLLSSFGLSNTQ
jgi:tetratricopeptide (TPR) repeat protein